MWRPSAVVLGDERAAHKLLAALLDIHDDGTNNAPEDRCYVEGAWKETLDDARAYLATSPQSTATQPVQTERALVDDDILRLAAQVLGNPLLFDDLKQDFTVHTEAGDWIKFARAILAAQPVGGADHDLS
jgi:hypothetical protein